VRVVVPVGTVDVRITVDDIGTRCGSDSGTLIFVGSQAGVRWSCRHEPDTRKVSPRELVDQERFEGVADSQEVQLVDAAVSQCDLVLTRSGSSIAPS
jgi:hypothetical protein